MKTKNIADQVAIVTGGGTGIGRAFTEALATAGAKVVIASRREDVLRRTADEMNATLDSERLFPYQFDLRDPAAIEELVANVFERWQAIDVLINNSGLAVPEIVEEI